MNASDVEAVFDRIGAILTGPGVSDVKELGVFVTPKPGATSGSSSSAASALRATPDALGIATWALTPLYRYAKHRLSTDRRDTRAAAVLLAVSPDFASAWAVRKECLLRKSTCGPAQSRPAAVAEEYHFNGLVVRRSPKSVEAWAHRSWLLRRFGLNEDDIRREFELTNIAATLVKSNYYAGVYRVQLVGRASPNTVASEIERNRDWLGRNVTDSSGWWYQGVLARTLKSLVPSDWPAVVEHELRFASDVVHRYASEKFVSSNKYCEWIAREAADFR